MYLFQICDLAHDPYSSYAEVGIVSVMVQLFVYDKAWAPFVQLVMWGILEFQGMIAIVVEGFESFVEIVACFVVPFVTT